MCPNALLALLAGLAVLLALIRWPAANIALGVTALLVLTMDIEVPAELRGVFRC